MFRLWVVGLELVVLFGCLLNVGFLVGFVSYACCTAGRDIVGLWVNSVELI